LHAQSGLIVRYDRGAGYLDSNHGSNDMITLEYRAPPHDLRHYISAYYLFETDEPLFEDIERADIAQFRAFLSGTGEIVYANGVPSSNYAVSLFGPRTASATVTLWGPVKLFGFGVLPAGWAAITKMSAEKFVDQLVDAHDIFGRHVDELFAQISMCESLDAMAQVVIDAARTYEPLAHPVPHWFVRAVDEWLESRLSPNITDLERTTGLSRRQIERMTKQLYGAAPKLLQRKYRALRTASAIANGQGDWQDFIDDAYYDQSHCIRELKEFVGITPNAIRDHQSRLSQLTFGRWHLAGNVAPLSAQT
jgi:AraC-like DNA-binding protein